MRIVKDIYKVFMWCFDNDDERQQYMYMYSEDNVHYFKHIITREYVGKTVEGMD